jgi:antitoxin ParD1/3/4
MATRNVVLTDHHQSMIERLVRTGRYQNASEVLREGLRLVEMQEAREAARLEAFRDAVRIGLDDDDADRVRSFEDFDALGTHLRSVGKAARSDGSRGK